MEEQIVLTPVMVKDSSGPDGHEVPSEKVFSILNGQYTMWYDEFSGKVRWSVARFLDDGLGIPTHGAARSKRLAAAACIENRKIRTEARSDRG